MCNGTLGVLRSVKPSTSELGIESIYWTDTIISGNSHFLLTPVNFLISDSGSSISSPITPSLSLSGDCTVQVSSFEEGPFPPFYNSSKSWLRITDSEYAPIRTASPTSVFVDTKAAGAKDMQMEMSIAALSVVAESDPLLGLHGMSYRFVKGWSDPQG